MRIRSVFVFASLGAAALFGACSQDEGGSADGSVDATSDTTTVLDAAKDVVSETSPVDAGPEAACATGTSGCANAQTIETCVGGQWVVADASCAGNTPACANGSCVECTSGVRCAGGAMQACSDAGAWANTSTCVDQGVASCGTNGACNEAGTACADYAAGTVCVAAACVNNNAKGASYCDNNEACDGGGATTIGCAPYLCDAGACASTCGNDNDCTAGNYCKSTACVAKGTQGAVCNAPDQCTTNFCATNHCCNTACTGVCDSCGSGMCTLVSAGSQTAQCTGVNACNAVGQCKLASNQPCVSSSDCASGLCQALDASFMTCL